MINLNKFPYNKMRDGQKQVLEKLRDNWDKYNYFVIEAPTGFGKSALAKTICASHNNAFLVTATKQLQDQYEYDFKDGTVRSIKGAANYPCNFNEKLNCECGPCMVNKGLLKECMRDKVCPYFNARQAALNANTALTSYQYFLRSTECGRFWKPRDVLILDECHLLESQVTQWAGMHLSPRELHEKYDIFKDVPPDRFIIVTAPPEDSGYDKNRLWLQYIWDLIVKRRNDLYKDIESSLGGKNPEELDEEELNEIASTHKEYYEIDKIYKRMHVFFEAKDKNTWIIEPHEDGLTIQPIHIGNLFHKYVNIWAKKVVFMSATILDLPGFCKQVGIPKEQTALVRIETTFDPEKSPIIYNPVGMMNYQSIDKTMPKIIEAIKDILDKHPNDKGIIHSGNYKIAKAIYEQIDSDRLIMKTNETENNEFLLKKHVRSKKPTVLVSPSLTTGADLKDELSRFQIFVKMPFDSLLDKRIKKKMENDNEWYVCEMFRKLVQACGRSTRSEEDWSVTYVLDTSFYKWVYQYKKWFTKQFLRRIVWIKDKFNFDDYKDKMVNQ